MGKNFGHSLIFFLLILWSLTFRQNLPYLPNVYISKNTRIYFI